MQDGSPIHAFRPLGCALCATVPRGAVSEVVLDVHSDLGLSLDGSQIVCRANKQATSRKLGGGGSNGQATKKNRQAVAGNLYPSPVLANLSLPESLGRPHNSLAPRSGAMGGILQTNSM